MNALLSSESQSSSEVLSIMWIMPEKLNKMKSSVTLYKSNIEDLTGIRNAHVLMNLLNVFLEKYSM